MDWVRTSSGAEVGAYVRQRNYIIRFKQYVLAAWNSDSEIVPPGADENLRENKRGRQSCSCWSRTGRHKRVEYIRVQLD